MINVNKYIQNQLSAYIDTHRIDFEKYKKDFINEAEYTAYKRALSSIDGITFKIFERWCNVLGIEVVIDVELSKKKVVSKRIKKKVK